MKLRLSHMLYKLYYNLVLTYWASSVPSLIIHLHPQNHLSLVPAASHFPLGPQTSVVLKPHAFFHIVLLLLILYPCLLFLGIIYLPLIVKRSVFCFFLATPARALPSLGQWTHSTLNINLALEILSVQVTAYLFYLA